MRLNRCDSDENVEHSSLTYIARFPLMEQSMAVRIKNNLSGMGDLCKLHLLAVSEICI